MTMTATPTNLAPSASPPPKPPRNDGTGLIEHDPWLERFSDALRRRFADWKAAEQRLFSAPDHAGEIDRGHEYFGLNRGTLDGKPGVWYREWAPAAKSLALFGEFNGWNRGSHPLSRGPEGVWSLFLPDDGPAPLRHGQKLKVHVVTAKGGMDRIPAWIRRAVQDDRTKVFDGQFWAPPEPYVFRHAAPPRPAAPRIYEAHPGMALEEGRVGTWAEFARNVLPRAAGLGYNAVQLMAVAEHPYYGSFGYHVSNFFAPSSRFGTPEDLKALVDEAHRLGLVVLMDLVHSHSVKNLLEGLNGFDGTEYQYFHAGPRGKHPGWDSLLFDYGKREVQRFLLSNIRYWMDEFGFDGFRFDGVTSMLYVDHGWKRTFNGYDDYFGGNVDGQAVTYLTLANRLVHRLKPDAVTVAEDVSGMPGMARPAEEGGLGFDYRLAMGLPDYWIKIIKERRDEDWHMGDLYHCLLHRRSWHGEKHVAYAESHDQALVGDKTIAHRLMDADMYHSMHVHARNLRIDRGVALHKMIRLISFALGGEGWLTFMGNEFGHPEWIDFPREGNNYSYHFARRQWSLAERQDLRYKGLNEFDRAMQRLDAEYGILASMKIEQLYLHEDDKLIVARRGPLVFAFNWHPTRSYEGLRFGVPERADYRLILDTDARAFSGHARVAENHVSPWQDKPAGNKGQSIQIYLPSRTAQVLAPTGGKPLEKLADLP